jgi:type 1 fimbria pilin
MMNKRFLKNTIGVLAAAMLLTGASAAQAGTATGSMTVTGTITDAPPPVTCNMAALTHNINFDIPAEGLDFFTKTQLLGFTCTAYVSFTISVPQEYNPLTVGGNSGLAVQVLTPAGSNIGITPLNIPGNSSSNKIVSLSMKYTGPAGARLTPTNIGAVSGGVPVTVTY